MRLKCVLTKFRADRGHVRRINGRSKSVWYGASPFFTPFVSSRMYGTEIHLQGMYPTLRTHLDNVAIEPSPSENGREPSIASNEEPMEGTLGALLASFEK